MKFLLLFLFSVPIFNSLEVKQCQQESLTDFLTSRKFIYELGIPIIHENGMKVHGKTEVSREFQFINDSLFQEVIYNETNFYDSHLNDSSGFIPLKNGYEVSVLEGEWELIDDSLIALEYKLEKIYDHSVFLQQLHVQLYEPNQIQEISELRKREWTESNYLNINEKHLLCIVEGLSRCYHPDY